MCHGGERPSPRDWLTGSSEKLDRALVLVGNAMNNELVRDVKLFAERGIFTSV